MKNFRFLLFFVTFWVIMPYQSFSQSFSFTYSGPTTVTVPFGSGSTGATYYFQYYQQGLLIRPRLTIALDGTVLTQGICQGGDSFLPSSYVITFTPGNHTVKFTLSDLGQNSNNCTQATIWQTEEFGVNSKYTINIQNNFAGGTIYVDNLSVSKAAPYGRSSNNSENILLGAIEQNDGTYNRIWNTSGINNSSWEINRNSIISTISNSQSFTYTTQSGDNNAVITSNLRKVTNITFQNNFISVGNGGVIKVNGTQVSSPTASYSVVELNPITATAVSQGINNITYYFTNWSTGSTYITETFYPTSNSTITSNFVGIAAQSVGLNFNASNPRQPITLNWTEYPNNNVTQYKIWRRIKYKKQPTENPVLLATLLRGITSYIDYDFRGTNLGFTDWMLWYDVRSYYATEGTYPNPNWAQVFSGGLIPKVLGEMTVKVNKIENYPNPFNPSTIIRYQIVKAGHVTLKVYDALGREVANLIDKQQPSGKYSVNFNASKLSSGIYLYRITANGFMSVKKMILLR